MQNSTDEYLHLLKQIDDLIARIDSTMEDTSTPFKKKTVRFSEHNEVFLIPPRELTHQQVILPIDFHSQDLNELFPNLFY